MVKKARAYRRAVIAAVCALLAALLIGAAWYVTTSRRALSLLSRPQAQLHGEQDAGYIPTATEPLELELLAPQAFVYDCQAEELLYRRGDDRVVYPASTTKLLTILCALEHLSPEETVTPGDELSLVGAGSSIAYIQPHHTLTVEMLVEGMLLPSGNDAAYALAAAAGHRIDPSATGAEAVAVFMDEMADYAASIGLVGTRFTSPDGLAGEEHYSTLEDILLISRLAMQNEVVARYASLAAADVTYASGHTNHWENTNELLHPDSPYYHAAVTGLKTGSLDRNYCLIFTATLDDRDYIVGLFGEWEKADRYTDAHVILDALEREGVVS